jgi:hypothetical protein
MRISRFKQYTRINEMQNSTPEQYIKNALLKVKARLEQMFAQSPGGSGEVKKFGEKEKATGSIADLGVELESIEMSRFSRVLDNVKVKFSDEDNLYDLFIGIELSEGIPKDDKKFSVDDIKNCEITFKKYDKANPGEVLAEINDTVKIDDIDEDMLIELKIKLDEDAGEEPKDEFEIETE